MFQLFQSYVAISVFMLQVTSVLCESCICFTHMLQAYVSNVSSASDVCCIQVFHVASVSYFRGMFTESLGHGSGVVGRTRRDRRMGPAAPLRFCGWFCLVQRAYSYSSS